tara:strand:+ start:1357 stop:2247 length:891 start_codon:yes stop_codon:yes gene_type:complete
MPYIGKSPTGTGVRSRYYFTASGGETSLSGASDSGATLSFTDGNYVDVSLNGVALVAGTDYNTTTANTIGGLTALSASDIVEILVYDIFTVADTVPASSGGTFSGGVTMGGALSLQSANFKMTDLTTNAFYRTGTFTPIWTSENVTTAYESNLFTAASYAIQRGDYVRIGNLVHATIYLGLDHSAAGYANGGSHSQSLGVYGLPFKVKNITNYNPMISTVYFSFDTDQGWSSYSLVGYGSPDKKHIGIFFSSAGGTVSPLQSGHVYGLPTGQGVPASSNAHDTEMKFQLTYETDEA